MKWTQKSDWHLETDCGSYRISKADTAVPYLLHRRLGSSWRPPNEIVGGYPTSKAAMTAAEAEEGE